jgi:hypothetical protein
MPGPTTNVFVSYSHSDESLVGPVVRLLRVNDSLVFQDKDRIPPGKRWREEIAKALAEAKLVVVFWCHHASESEEVFQEWTAAVAQKKDVLPLLLDETPLPEALGAFQWIDFRAVVGANHRAVYSRPDEFQARAKSPAPQAASPPARAASPSAKAASSRRTVWYVPVGIAAAAAVVFGLLFVSFGLDAVGWILLLVAVVALLMRLSRSLQRRSTRPEGIEHRIAAELEAAIIKRTAPKS